MKNEPSVLQKRKEPLELRLFAIKRSLIYTMQSRKRQSAFSREEVIRRPMGNLFVMLV
jgi:hypothetical protein